MAWDLWYGAKKYMLPYLVDECHKYISSVLDARNACKAYEFARLFDEKPLVDICLKVIFYNLILAVLVMSAASFCFQNATQKTKE